MERKKLKAILTLVGIFTIWILFFYMVGGAIVFKPFLSPFNLNNHEARSDNYCWSSASIGLTNLTRDPIYQFGNKCCTISQKWRETSYDFFCIEMDNETEAEWGELYG